MNISGIRGKKQKVKNENVLGGIAERFGGAFKPKKSVLSAAFEESGAPLPNEPVPDRRGGPGGRSYSTEAQSFFSRAAEDRGERPRIRLEGKDEGASRLPVLQRQDGEKRRYSRDVKDAQEILTDRGYGDVLGSSGADGYFGPATERAVKAFQMDNDLDPTGKVDEKTWAALMSRSSLD